MEEEAIKAPEQLKKFNFFAAETLPEQLNDPRVHSTRLSDIAVTDVGLAKSKLLLLDRGRGVVFVFGRGVEGSWTPHNQAVFGLWTFSTIMGDLVLTAGEDAEGQMRNVSVSIWLFEPNPETYATMKPKKNIILGRLGDAERIINCVYLLPDLTLLIIGTKRGTIVLNESRNLLESVDKVTTRIIDKKEILAIKAFRGPSGVDLYFANEEAFFWFENLAEKRRISQGEVEFLEVTKTGGFLVAFKNDPRKFFEYRGGKQSRVFNIQGSKCMVRPFSQNYLVVVTLEKKNERIERSTDKYVVQILDTLNQYIAYSDTFLRVESVQITDHNIVLLIVNQKGERVAMSLTEKDNSFKIETFFKKLFYNEAYRFAKNQSCHPSLLAEISREHGDLSYSKGQFANAIKQYNLTLGYLEPSYVIRKFLDVAQIDYLIEYLQKIHEQKLAKKEHTALLLNCYVKKHKIDHLSRFLSESSLQNDMFDIETAIKVCKDLGYLDEAMKLARQKEKHEQYLKILIQSRKDYLRALVHIRSRVKLEEKEKFILEFGQDFMKFVPKETIELIRLMIRAQTISLVVSGKQKEYALSADQKNVFEQLCFDVSELENLTVITFKKPEEFFRLFLANSEELEDFLLFLNRQITKPPHEQVVYHRLIEFYLETMRESPSRMEECSKKIIEQLSVNKKADNNHLLALFKMHDFDEGVITLCRKLGMRDDLLNFYIARDRDQDIMNLCKHHGVEEVNLWIHALKYFVKPDNKKEYRIPEILTELSQIPNLSPLPILSILGKNKNIQYQYVKQFFLQKLREDRATIDKDRELIARNLKKADESRGEYKKLKTTAKPFLSNNCVQCQNPLSFQSIHFMCGHSFHQNCLPGEKQCSRCGFEMRNIIERRSKYAEEAQDQTRLFQNLLERKESGFDVVAEFFGRGLFAKKETE